jgi:hypothetical protein
VFVGKIKAVDVNPSLSAALVWVADKSGCTVPKIAEHCRNSASVARKPDRRKCRSRLSRLSRRAFAAFSPKGTHAVRFHRFHWANAMPITNRFGESDLTLSAMETLAIKLTNCEISHTQRRQVRIISGWPTNEELLHSSTQARLSVLIQSTKLGLSNSFHAAMQPTCIPGIKCGG